MKLNEFGLNFMAITLAFSIHLALGALLLWNADFSSEIEKPANAATPPGIETVMVDQNLIKEQAEKIREQREAAKQAEAERLRKIEQQAKLMEKQREAEEQQLREIQAKRLAEEKAAREAEIERQRVAEEQRKAKEAIRIAEEKAKVAEARRLQQLEDARKAEEAAKKAEEAARKAAEAVRLAEEQRQEAERQAKEAERQMLEAERQRREAERQKAEQEAALEELFSGLESESINRNSARGQQIQNEVDAWSARYETLIKQYWRVDPSMIGNQCRLNLRIGGTGFVTAADKVDGNDAVCNSARLSVLRINQFPLPEDPDVKNQLRNITITFEPK